MDVPLVPASSPVDESQPGAGALQGMIGRSCSYCELVKYIRIAARSNAPVLIEGETGSGKELAARAVHYLSQRRDKPFVPVNCGAIPETLIESEFFGHARGAFTDAKQPQIGVVAHADSGTLFLDEVDTLPPKGQVALLRFLQDRRYRPLGHSTERHSDTRIIAASNVQLHERVHAGEFRSDLLYRLNILLIRVPPLRERREDLPLLAEHFLQVYRARYGLPRKRLHPTSLSWMQHYCWPGNIRELENLLHRQVLLSDGEVVHLTGEQMPTAVADDGFPDFQHAKAEAIESFERGYLMQVMTEARGNVTAAARLACKERRALGKLLKKHGIDKNRYRSP